MYSIMTVHGRIYLSDHVYFHKDAVPSNNHTEANKKLGMNPGNAPNHWATVPSRLTMQISEMEMLTLKVLRCICAAFCVLTFLCAHMYWPHWWSRLFFIGSIKFQQTFLSRNWQWMCFACLRPRPAGGNRLPHTQTHWGHLGSQAAESNSSQEYLLWCDPDDRK